MRIVGLLCSTFAKNNNKFIALHCNTKNQLCLLLIFEFNNELNVVFYNYIIKTNMEPLEQEETLGNNIGS